MSNDHAWLSFMIFVNSSARAGKDSYDVGSSRMGVHVRATGRLWSPSNEEKQILIESQVITSLPVQKRRNIESAFPSNDFTNFFKYSRL